MFRGTLILCQIEVVAFPIAHLFSSTVGFLACPPCEVSMNFNYLLLKINIVCAFRKLQRLERASESPGSGDGERY